MKIFRNITPSPWAMLALALCAAALFAPGVRAAEGIGVLTLDRVVEMALDHSYLNRAAGQDVMGADQERIAARADLFPKLQAHYSYASLGDQPYANFGGHATPVGSSTNYHWDLTVIQPLFTGFALTSRHDMARLQVEVKKLEQQQVALDVVRDAKRAYFNLLLAQKTLKVAEQTVESLEAQVADSNRFYEQGLIPLNDLLRSQVALADIIQRREKAASGVRLAEVSLNLLLGLAPGSHIKVEDVEEAASVNQSLDELREQAKKERPILLAGKKGLDTLELAVKATRSAYYPQVSAFGQYEQNGDNPAANSNDYSNRYNSSVGVQLEWTFFEFGKTRAKTAKSRHDLGAAKQRVRALEDGVVMEVEAAFQDQAVAEKNIRTARQVLEQARENQRITRLQYKHQAATATDVLNAETDLVGADLNYYQSLYGYMIYLAQLDRAVGGPVEGPSPMDEPVE